jgi:hypothetical protein
MTSFLNLDRTIEPPAPQAPAPEVAKAPAAPEESSDYEIVVGRRQVAGIALVAIVLLAVFSGVSYLIGKSMANPAVTATSAPVVPAPAVQVPAPQAPAPAPALPQQLSSSTGPVLAEAVPGKVYLQVGVIEKGLAGIWAEGLRTHGLEAFAAPGPNDGLGLWRVLIGPIPDPQAYQRAKDALTALGLNNFGRRYPPQ